MLLGITGTDGAGKGTVVEYLVDQKGFTHYSARQVFITELTKEGKELTRENFRRKANELRATHGNDFLITYYQEKMLVDQPQNAIIESIRALAEAKTLQENGGILIVVDANQQVRYERIVARQSSSDQVTFAEFVAQEALEMNDPDPNGMQKAAVMAAADFTLSNDGSRAELHEQIETMLTKLQKK